MIRRRLVILGLGIAGVTAGLATPVHADLMGQSVCSMLVAPGASFDSVVAGTAAGKGLTPHQAGALTVVAMATHCPAALAPLLTNQLLG